MSRATLARPRRARVRAGAAGRDLAELLAAAPAIGEDELAWWPRAAGRQARALAPWPLADLARWVLDHARPERDELLHVRLDAGGAVVDAALAVLDARGLRGWAPAGAGWRPLGHVEALLAGVAEEDAAACPPAAGAVCAVGARLEAALAARDGW